MIETMTDLEARLRLLAELEPTSAEILLAAAAAVARINTETKFLSVLEATFGPDP